MGTDKRERKKAGHRARLNAERAAQARYERRRRLTITIAVPLAVLLVIGLVAVLSKGSGTATDSASSSTSATSSTVSTSTTVAAKPASAAGKPCVALSEPAPDNAPTVDIPLGPPPTTLQITDIRTGTGPAVTASDSVTVDYIGVACSTGAIFDSSYVRGQPATFGLNQVIPGWTEGLQGMQAGGVRELVIPPDKGYGSTGQGVKIAPDETLIFVVELRSISSK